MDRNGASKVVEQAEVNNLKGEEEEVKVTNGVAKVEKKEKIQWSPIKVIWDGLKSKSQKKSNICKRHSVCSVIARIDNTQVSLSLFLWNPDKPMHIFAHTYLRLQCQLKNAFIWSKRPWPASSVNITIWDICKDIIHLCLKILQKSVFNIPS